MDRENSPFHTLVRASREEVWILGQNLDAFDQTAGTSSAFQYLILLRNSDVPRPIEQ
jgi:hypothetical protein